MAQATADVPLLVAQAALRDVVLSDSVKFELYGYYKQATLGLPTTSRPPLSKPLERQKYQAWLDVATLSTDEATRGYISVVDRVIPGWRNTLSKTGEGVAETKSRPVLARAAADTLAQGQRGKTLLESGGTDKAAFRKARTCGWQSKVEAGTFTRSWRVTTPAGSFLIQDTSTQTRGWNTCDDAAITSTHFQAKTCDDDAVMAAFLVGACPPLAETHSDTPAIRPAKATSAAPTPRVRGAAGIVIVGLSLFFALLARKNPRLGVFAAFVTMVLRGRVTIVHEERTTTCV